MNFNNIIGQKNIKKFLIKIIKNNKIPPSIFFLGSSGYGPLLMALTFSKYLLCDNNDINCKIRVDNFHHPDLYFTFPVFKNKKLNRSFFLKKWISFLKENPYGDLYDWLKILNAENKNLQIGVEEIENIIDNISLKSFEGKYKIIILWMPEKLNIQASNKILKTLENPPEKTMIFLIGEKEKNILPTILSRTQIIRFKKNSSKEIKEALIKKFSFTKKKINNIVYLCDGNFNTALKLCFSKIEDKKNNFYFLIWMKSIFFSKKYKEVLCNFIKLSEKINKWGKERQKKFLIFSLFFFRKILEKKYSPGENYIFYLYKYDKIFLKYFNKNITWNKIKKINMAINFSIDCINKNANFKILFFDLSIKISKYYYS